MDNTTNTVVTADPADVEKNKVMAILSYIGILFLVPVLAAKESKFAMFHANQGLWLFIIEIVLSVISLIPFVGCIAMLALLAAVVYAILGIVNASKGEMKPLPGFASLPVLIK